MAGLLLAGCGGSGGGPTNLIYTTDWTNFQGATGGQSEIVTLFNPTGAQIGQITLNQGSTPASTTTTFMNLPGGSYHIEVQLFSSTNGGGTQVGQLDAQLNVPQVKSFATTVGGTVASIGVTPSRASVPLQESVQFYASGYTSAGTATFLAANSITWSVLGSNGTIDPASGLFLGTNPGTASVQAAQSSSGLNGAATVTVTQIVTTHGVWTIMVYMNAANDLSTYSLANFTQMQQVANAGTNVRTVVQWKQVSSLPYPAQFNGTRRYLIQPSQSSTIASKLVQDLGSGFDMGNFQTLTNFINWAKTYYPADHYALIVWDHGAGWQRSVSSLRTRAVSFDNETGSVIQTWQLSQALGNNTFDILAWDASLMQMAEVSDEIRSKVTYIAGSEESPPGSGYPYNLALGPFYANPNQTALALSKSFVDAMVNGYASTQYKITQSVIDTSKLPAVLTGINDLGTALDANASAVSSAIPTARNNTQSYSLVEGFYYFDLYDLTSKLDTGISITAVNNADAEIRAAVKSAVVWEGHNGLSPGSHGISIDFSTSSVFAGYASDYAQLRMATDTDWATWLAQAP
ncbi:MAG TPA: clostripain-related cysteine peptidase [Fimbriimonadaceae bacterium]|nr:clostripain-related cysteine peptidase [Fimbriimonadaceae bacterium]